MSINSEKTFKRVMIENGLEYDESDYYGEQHIFYGLNIVKDIVEIYKGKIWLEKSNSFGGLKVNIILPVSLI